MIEYKITRWEIPNTDSYESVWFVEDQSGNQFIDIGYQYPFSFGSLFIPIGNDVLVDLQMGTLSINSIVMDAVTLFKIKNYQNYHMVKRELLYSRKTQNSIITNNLGVVEVKTKQTGRLKRSILNRLQNEHQSQEIYL